MRDPVDFWSDEEVLDFLNTYKREDVNASLKYKIDEEDWDRFMRLRSKLFKAIKESLEIDNYCKSYEGRFDIEMSLPNYFEGGEQPPTWGIHLACYVIGPNRGEDWYGDTFREALLRAEKDIVEWIADHDDWMKIRKEDVKNLERKNN